MGRAQGGEEKAGEKYIDGNRDVLAMLHAGL